MTTTTTGPVTTSEIIAAAEASGWTAEDAEWLIDEFRKAGRLADPDGPETDPDPAKAIPDREDDVARYASESAALAAAAPGEAVVQGSDYAWYRIGLAWALWTLWTPNQKRAWLVSHRFGFV
jgi:hypothetical protein